LNAMVELIAASSMALALADQDHGDEIDAATLLKAIASARVAIANYEVGCARTNEAICLLFRAVERCNGDNQYPEDLLQSAEELLGMVKLEKAVTKAVS